MIAFSARPRKTPLWRGHGPCFVPKKTSLCTPCRGVSLFSKTQITLLAINLSTKQHMPAAAYTKTSWQDCIKSLQSWNISKIINRLSLILSRTLFLAIRFPLGDSSVKTPLPFFTTPLPKVDMKLVMISWKWVARGSMSCAVDSRTKLASSSRGLAIATPGIQKHFAVSICVWQRLEPE